MFGRRSAVAVVAAVLLGLGLFATAQPTFALSEGCEAADGYVSLVGFTGFRGLTWRAGERVAVEVLNSMVVVTTARLFVGSVEVDSAPLTGGGTVTLEYTFPVTAEHDVIAGADDSAAYIWSCAPAPAPAANTPGPSIPEGFVLRTVTCDTPLYATANGTPVVGGAAVTAGQTWYLAPEEETPGWIEGFFGGWTNAWLPAACVG